MRRRGGRDSLPLSCHPTRTASNAAQKIRGQSPKPGKGGIRALTPSGLTVDAAVAMADGDHDAIGGENGVGAAQPLGRARGGRVALCEPRARLLVPVEDLDA